MLKILMKKQMREVGAFLYQNNKKGTRRSKGNLIGYIIVLLLLYTLVGSIFYTVSEWLCAPLATVELDWLYFALMGLMAVILGVFGSVFNTFSSLYMAKDNEMLLSMPVKPRDILLARLFGVYMMGLFYEALVMVPAIIVYAINVEVNVLSIVYQLILLLVLSFFVLTLSCVLGWVVALISTRLKNKSFITVILSLGFITGYYYVYFKASSYLQHILQNAGVVGDAIKNKVFPIYHMGVAATGNTVSLLIVTGMIAVITLLIYMILLHSFMKIMMTKKGEKKVAYKAKAMSAGSVNGALLRKEAKRFTGSATYMLNCSLGVIMLLLTAVVMVWKADVVQKLIGKMGSSSEYIVLIAAVAVCLLTTMNDITAPSVSLEGKNIWILQSLPVSSWQILKAKLKLHLVITLVPVLICIVCMEYALMLDVISLVLIAAVTILFVAFCALFGLVLGLKMPNLEWSNETAAVKQGINVMIALFGSWAVIMLLGGVYVAVHQFISPEIYLVCCIVLFGILDVAMTFWLKNKGSRIFENLG